MSCLGSTLSILFMTFSFLAMVIQTFLLATFIYLEQCLCGATAGFGLFFFASSYDNIAALGMNDLGLLLGISGMTMFMVKFLGLCGAALESKLVTRVFYGILCAGLFVQGTAGILSMIREAKV